ncbi:helix-turn-helix domain-containing protein [Methanothrix sp.]|uniref:helix-turn-helix domain-containing protein n=1 Tax=Methanothrix sp. TaxID=90426 RepID=UPI00329A26B4
MHLSENEVRALILITRSLEPVNPRDIQKELDLFKGSVSRIITSLQDIGLVERAKGAIHLARTPPAEAFKRLYYSHRASPLQEILSGRRVELLSRLVQNPKSLKALARETGISSDTVYYYLQGFLQLGLTSRSMESKAYLYSFNYILWKDLMDFVSSLLEYQVLRLVPSEALLIKSYGDSVLFKSIRQQDATPTSFSAYEDYGIELGLRDNYYTLPKRELSIEEIFIHSLDSAEDYRQRLFCILFYLKNKDKLQGALHPMAETIRTVLRGEHIKGYSTLEEIEEQAELYGIQDIEA